MRETPAEYFERAKRDQQDILAMLGHPVSRSTRMPALTPDEFAAAQDRADWRAPMELIGREAVVIPPSGSDVSLPKTELVYLLRTWEAEQDAGGTVLMNVFVRVGDGYLAPGVAWWAPENRPQIGSGAVQTVPDLVVEVLSPAGRSNDLGAKQEMYLAAGVRELWLIDAAQHEATIVGAAGEHRLSAADRLRSEILPGFTLSVAALFA